MGTESRCHLFDCADGIAFASVASTRSLPYVSLNAASNGVDDLLRSETHFRQIKNSNTRIWQSKTPEKALEMCTREETANSEQPLVGTANLAISRIYCPKTESTPCRPRHRLPPYCPYSSEPSLSLSLSSSTRVALS